MLAHRAALGVFAPLPRDTNPSRAVGVNINAERAHSCKRASSPHIYTREMPNMQHTLGDLRASACMRPPRVVFMRLPRMAAARFALGEC